AQTSCKKVRAFARFTPHSVAARHERLSLFTSRPTGLSSPSYHLRRHASEMQVISLQILRHLHRVISQKRDDVDTKYCIPASGRCC
ncbi:hypothetical protein NGA_2117200, partial [Nannochloropsis gaditana CCMP526]|uniref:uncharacterized protein n=1 Tax=Nannochloropsis gaditana (strain CCMP526) TaxID=1093141 RepID=UPI00029F630F